MFKHVSAVSNPTPPEEKKQLVWNKRAEVLEIESHKMLPRFIHRALWYTYDEWSDMEERNLTDMQDEGWFDEPGPDSVHGMPDGFDPEADQRGGAKRNNERRPLFVAEPHSSEDEESVSEPQTPLSPETPEMFRDSHVSENGSANKSDGGRDSLASQSPGGESERYSASGSVYTSESESESESDSNSEEDLSIVDDERKAKRAAKKEREEERRRQLRAMYGVSTEDTTTSPTTS